MTVPEIVIRVPLEGWPKLYVIGDHDKRLRLADWAERCDLPRLVEATLDLLREEAA